MLPDIFKSVVEEKLYPMVASLHLSVFARIILQNPGFFWQFLEQLAKELGTTSSDALASFLDSWFDKMDGVIQTERKKLCSLSLASLLTCNESVMLQRFGAIINVCVEALHDVCRSDDDTSGYIDALVQNSTEELPEDELETEHEKRKRLLCRQDPVYTINLKDYILLQLQTCQQQHGEETFRKTH
ncbi:Importin-11 [Lamellibrachia satsuma]|nr:Importin-11 [Lamellibrachia satsuma]